MDPEAQQDLHARQIVYEAIATPLVDLAGEVQASLNFYRRQHRNEEIDRILLSGGSAVIPGLGDFIAAETGVTVELADPFAELLTDEDRQPGAYLRDIGPTMVVAVGLALRDMVES
jgi:type IV pilus assembly protein PilM